MHNYDVFWPLFTGGACLLVWFATRWIERTRIQRRRAMMTPWQVRLENALREYIDTMLHAAEVEKELAFIVQDIPKEFVAATFKAMALAQALPRAVLREARKRGLLSVELEVERGDVAQAEQQAAVNDMGHDSVPPPSMSQQATRSSPPPPLRSVGRRWKDGEVQPRPVKVA